MTVFDDDDFKPVRRLVYRFGESTVTGVINEDCSHTLGLLSFLFANLINSVVE